MFTFDRTKFFDGYRARFGPLKQSIVDALELLLAKIEQDGRFPATDNDRRQIAYCLATFKWETAHTFEPIDELGSESYFDKRYGPHTAVGKRLGNTQPKDGSRFHGRGYVQLTGRANYKKAGDALGVSLVNQPELAKDPGTAYEIAIEGMKKGWFTGKRLDTYIKADRLPDYENARRVINGLDKAVEIENIARHFSEILRVAKV